MTSALHTSALKSLTLLARGKVRDNYAVGSDRILMVASDRLSAFDVIMGEPIPGKGALLTQMALFWFDKLGPNGLNICRIHLTGDAPESVVTAATGAGSRSGSNGVPRAPVTPTPRWPTLCPVAASAAHPSHAVPGGDVPRAIPGGRRSPCDWPKA